MDIITATIAVVRVHKLALKNHGVEIIEVLRSGGLQIYWYNRIIEIIEIELIENFYYSGDRISAGSNKKVDKIEVMK